MIDELANNLILLSDDIYNNARPEYILEGHAILGVQGTLKDKQLQTKDAQPSISGQTIVPDIGYDGLNSVRIPAVTKDIDSDILPSNIKYSANILGVQGTLSGLSQEDYNTALQLENQILGYETFVIGDKLVINTATVTSDKITVDGTVTDDKLVLN